MIFREKISEHYASKFKGGQCPLRRQVEFSEEENAEQPEFEIDPLGEREAHSESGILRKYKGRLLVLTGGECAINCRFCFRRNMKPKKIGNLPGKLHEMLKKDSSIKEVILSGGDPLMISNAELGAFFDAIPSEIAIRIHSRAPIAMPSRFTPALHGIIGGAGKRILVAHVNHPSELDKESESIFRQLRERNVVLLSQSVLLKGVNDNASALARLSEKLFSQGVLPYYLHQLDRAKGAAHFEVPMQRAEAIFAELKTLLPGYLVPKFVKEIKGEKSKTWIG